MASTTDILYIMYVETDRELLKICGQRRRIGATYTERELLQLLSEFERSLGPHSTRIRDGSESDILAKMTHSSEQVEEYYLSGIAASPGGWTVEIINKIGSGICYEEFPYQIVTTVGDQKIIKIQFYNEDFSNYLVKKQLASPLSLPVQRQIISTYCSLVSNEKKPESVLSDIPRMTCSTSLPPPNTRVSLTPSNAINGGTMQLNYEKVNDAVNFSLPSPGLQYSSSRHVTSTYQQMNSNIFKNSYFPTPNHLRSRVPVNNSPSQLINSVLNPLLSHECDPLYRMKKKADLFDSYNNIINPVLNPLLSHECDPLYRTKENADLFNRYNNIIQILAQQVKQYVAEKKNAKSECKEENYPHHYVNSVLEVGNTYNVVISYISDGPWSFSIRLLSSETELQKLTDELSSIELVPIKPPIILGDSCIASSALYGNLCRGVVVSISRGAVKVFFVDFGNTEDLPSSSIYKLPSKFFKIRVLSQKFSLSGLQKVAYSDDIKKFFKVVVQDELLLLRVISLEDDSLPTCELYLKDENVKRVLNEKIRKLKNSALEYFPKVGDTENVIVTWVISPQKFFVQLSKRDADLKALKEELAGVDTKGQRLTYQELFVGFKCISRYETDGQWHRAVITSIDSEDAITVFYVDYGNTETVSISILRKIDSSKLINQMGNQAIQCGLNGFENKPFDGELANKLEVLILEKQLQMSVVASGKEFLCVRLFKSGQDISELLLSATSSKIELLKKCSQSRDSGKILVKKRDVKETSEKLADGRGQSFQLRTTQHNLKYLRKTPLNERKKEYKNE